MNIRSRGTMQQMPALAGEIVRVREKSRRAHQKLYMCHEKGQKGNRRQEQTLDKMTSSYRYSHNLRLSPGRGPVSLSPSSQRAPNNHSLSVTMDRTMPRTMALVPHARARL